MKENKEFMQHRNEQMQFIKMVLFSAVAVDHHRYFFCIFYRKIGFEYIPGLNMMWNCKEKRRTKQNIAEQNFQKKYVKNSNFKKCGKNHSIVK